ncbi:MAG: nitrogen fixation protein NifZ [Thiotrichales bacterium]
MSRYEMGDLVFATHDLHNDAIEETGASAIPGLEPGELLAAAGTRGVIVNVGYAETDPGQEIYLVRFETGADGTLSAPVGCLPEEIGYGADA